MQNLLVLMLSSNVPRISIDFQELEKIKFIQLFFEHSVPLQRLLFSETLVSFPA